MSLGHITGDCAQLAALGAPQSDLPVGTRPKIARKKVVLPAPSGPEEADEGTWGNLEAISWSTCLRESSTDLIAHVQLGH